MLVAVCECRGINPHCVGAAGRLWTDWSSRANFGAMRRCEQSHFGDELEFGPRASERAGKSNIMT
jgi:hypothetical protein